MLPRHANPIMLGFKEFDLGHRLRKLGLGAAARVASVIAGVASVVVVSRTAVPYSAAVISSAIPVVRAWMAPPFLLAAIHFIILIIWKLSENKHRDDPPPVDDDMPPVKIAWPDIPQNAASADFAESEVIKPSNYPDVGRSMSDQNTDLDIKLDSLEIEKGDFTIMSVQEPPMVLAAAAAVAAEDDSMEARWKAIMQGGAAPVARFMVPGGGEMVREASEVGQEDLNQRFDEFIKKNYEQIRVATALRDG